MGSRGSSRTKVNVDGEGQAAGVLVESPALQSMSELAEGGSGILCPGDLPRRHHRPDPRPRFPSAPAAPPGKGRCRGHAARRGAFESSRSPAGGPLTAEEPTSPRRCALRHGPRGGVDLS